MRDLPRPDPVVVLAHYIGLKAGTVDVLEREDLGARVVVLGPFGGGVALGYNRSPNGLTCPIGIARTPEGAH